MNAKQALAKLRRARIEDIRGWENHIKALSKSSGSLTQINLFETSERQADKAAMLFLEVEKYLEHIKENGNARTS